MFVLVLAAEADETRQAITFLIVCLVGIAALLALLTVWYWHHTSPRRLWAEALADQAAAAESEPGSESEPESGPEPESAIGSAPASVPTAPPAAPSVEVEPDPAERSSLVVPSRRERIEVIDRSPAAAPEPESVVEVELGVESEPELEPALERPLVSASVAKVPTRKAEAESAGDGLSDDDWAAVMKSAFDKLQK